jgi:hypothetical protein
VWFVALAAVSLLVVAAWFVSGYAPRLVMENRLLAPLAFSSDGTRAALGSLSGSLPIWEIPPRKSPTAVLWTATLGAAVMGLLLAYKSLRARPIRAV